MDSLEAESKTKHTGKKNNYSPLKEANNSKEIQVELLLKDIKAAALKRVSSVSGKENQNKVPEDSRDEGINNEQDSLEITKPKTNDQTNCLGQNGNACICENLFGNLDNQHEQLENGMENGVSSFIDKNRGPSIYDNITTKMILPSETSENSSFQNGDVSFYSEEITPKENGQKDIDHSKRKESDQNGSDNDILNKKKLLGNNEEFSDVKSSESPIENGEDSVFLNGTAANEENSIWLSRSIKNDSETEPASPTSVKDIVQLKVIQEIIQEDKKLMDFTDDLILSGNVATKRPHSIDTMSDKDPLDSENDDKDNSPNFTSSVSEEEDPMEEGICIIINGKRLPPASESELEILRNSKEQISTINQDGIDPNQSGSSVFESIEEVIDVTDSIEYSGSISDQESTSRENSISQSQSSNKTDILSAILDMTSRSKSGKGNISPDTPDTPTIDEKNIRPIIHSFIGDTNRRPVRTQSLNMKSVTFSQDTVFNEDKTKRYRKERVSLRNIYRNRMTGSEAYAKINPLFEEDSDEGEGYATKGQSPLERRGSFIYLGDDETSANENTDGDSPIDKAVLNFPAYMQRFLQNESNSISSSGKSTGGNSESTISEIGSSFRDQTNEKLASSIKSSVKSETAETPTIKVTNPDKDEGHVHPEVPGYDVLIKKTIAKQQHHFFMKCSLVFLFVCGLLAIVAIIVYFLIIKRLDN